MIPEETRKYLLERGYREWGMDRIRDAYLFQKRLRFSTAKQYVNVWFHELEMRDGRIHQSYSVESIFETKNKQWVKLEYYSLNEKDLRKGFAKREKKLRSAFLLFEGAGRD